MAYFYFLNCFLLQNYLSCLLKLRSGRLLVRLPPVMLDAVPLAVVSDGLAFEVRAGSAAIRSLYPRIGYRIRPSLPS